MRKIIIKSLYLIGTLVLFLNSSLLAFGITLDDPLLKEIDFNKEESVLSGTTVPAANISLVDVVSEVIADEDGHFELPIPPDLEKSQIQVNDYIEDQSTTIEFDFKRGEIVKAEEQGKSTTNKLTTAETEAVAITGQSLPNTTNSTVPAQTEPTTPAISPWLYAIIALVLVFVGLLLYLIKRQKEAKKQAKLAEETKDKPKRKRRRKKKSTRHH